MAEKIINNFTISIPEKSIVSIIGKSGSGKSTILNMIGMLEKVDSGEIKINGKKITIYQQFLSNEIEKRQY